MKKGRGKISPVVEVVRSVRANIAWRKNKARRTFGDTLVLIVRMTQRPNRPYYSLNNEQLRTSVEVIDGRLTKPRVVTRGRKLLSDSLYYFFFFSLPPSSLLSSFRSRKGKRCLAISFRSTLYRPARRPVTIGNNSEEMSWLDEIFFSR